MDFAQNVKDMMKLREMTITDLAIKANLSRQTIYRYLRLNRVDFKMKTIKQIAKALGCTTGWLLREGPVVEFPEVLSQKSSPLLRDIFIS